MGKTIRRHQHSSDAIESATDRRTHILDAAVRVIAQHGVRGLRVAELGAEANVSTALIYYHFADRDGIVSAALDHVNDRARRYTTTTGADLSPRDELETMLLAELQDTNEVRVTSVAWGELRASAMFAPSLREALQASTDRWNRDVAEVVARLPDRTSLNSAETAAMLTALVEGLSSRWHSGSITLDEARRLLRGAIALESCSKQPPPDEPASSLPIKTSGTRLPRCDSTKGSGPGR